MRANPHSNNYLLPPTRISSRFGLNCYLRYPVPPTFWPGRLCCYENRISLLDSISTRCPRTVLRELSTSYQSRQTQHENSLRDANQDVHLFQELTCVPTFCHIAVCSVFPSGVNINSEATSPLRYIGRSWGGLTELYYKYGTLFDICPSLFDSL
ncbi:uncharacterized protein EI90DRAFT_100664 [Cantharellus anzutake]|uniref:uncharacterized protein n=1 Tax=Cantharellus anzutake TaxID=1750568 RepID=UPI001902E706|nr:uncharacterized protein EI90DRAFT_100664 [Cantharellus anzutake]KAF8337014.1 hypothetical protein EI90DRAFT_100664 [Cantharellus anzutake]